MNTRLRQVTQDETVSFNGRQLAHRPSVRGVTTTRFRQQRTTRNNP